jgi:uncharacterized protein YoxC
MASNTDCCVCTTSMFHYGYDPVGMGCQCSERICRWCVQVGKVVHCPICRKHKRKPVIDKKWKKAKLQEHVAADTVLACLGCDSLLPVSQISSHEHACLKYRDFTEALHIETFQLYRDRANNYELEVRELNDRMSLQEQEIEDLEDTCDDFKMTLAVVEAEKRVYAFEQQSVLTALNKITRPLQSVTKKVQEINEAVEKVKAQMQEARDSHRAFSQKRRRVSLGDSDSDDDAVLVTEIVHVRDEEQEVPTVPTVTVTLNMSD